MQINQVSVINMSVRKSIKPRDVRSVFENQLNVCKIDNVEFGKHIRGFKHATVYISQWNQPNNTESADLVHNICTYRTSRLWYEYNRYWNIYVNNRHNIVNLCYKLKFRIAELEEQLHHHHLCQLNVNRRKDSIENFNKNIFDNVVADNVITPLEESYETVSSLTTHTPPFHLGVQPDHDDTEVASADDTEVASADDTEVASADDTEVASADDTEVASADDTEVDVVESDSDDDDSGQSGSSQQSIDTSSSADDYSDDDVDIQDTTAKTQEIATHEYVIVDEYSKKLQAIQETLDHFSESYVRCTRSMSKKHS
jgi:hypothetical protein